MTELAYVRLHKRAFVAFNDAATQPCGAVPLSPAGDWQSNGDAYWVEDASGQGFAFCYHRNNQSIGSGRRSYLTKDQARRIASNVARLPKLIKDQTG